MADNPRIHPVDVESARPSAPLVPRDLTVSEKGDPSSASHPPQPRRILPVSHSRPPKKPRSCCCKCLCWTILTLILLIVAIAATIGILYLIFDPKIPKYSVNRLSISTFKVDTDLNVHAGFDVTVRAENPNKRIGIYYEDGSRLEVLYGGASLCTGAFPVFYQGHRNTTVLTVGLTGESKIGGELMNALQEAQQTGRVPLEFKGDVPVRVKFGALKLWKVTSKVRCDLVVNSLSVNSQISIQTSSCKFKLKL